MNTIALKSLEPVLDSLEQPVFAVVKRTVVYGNPAFQELGITAGVPLTSFFISGVSIPVFEESAIEDTTCVVAGKQFVATVRCINDAQLFILNPIRHDAASQLLTHSVNNIRLSLHGMYDATAALCEQVEVYENRELQDCSSAVLRGVFQMERMAENLDMLQRLENGSRRIRYQQTDILAFLNEIFAKAASLLGSAHRMLEVTLPDRLFNGSIDRQLVELAIWNLLSNAARHTNGETIHVTVLHRGETLQLNVVSSTRGEAVLETQHLFRRFEAPLESRNSGEGIGVGISLVREIAMQHSGNLMLSVSGTDVIASVTFGLQHSSEYELHYAMPTVQTLDAGLVGMSDVLPSSAFDSRDIV